MAYFDDPRNREGWENVMKELRSERERRLSGETPTAVAPAKEAGIETGFMREPVTIWQLEEEERLERSGVSSPQGAVRAGRETARPESSRGERTI